MKRVIGVILVLISLGFIIGMTVVSCGWKVALIAWGVAVALATMIVGGIMLICR